MYKQNIVATGIMGSPKSFDFSNVHINKHTRFDENGQSLLGYTDIAIYLVFNYIGMAMGAFKSRESYEYIADGQVGDLQALNLVHWYTIYSQA